jgi:hypothetical protein
MARKLRIIKTRRRVVILITSLVLMIAVTILIALLGQPSKGKIINSTQQDNASLDIDDGTSTLKGMYFTMQYRTSLNTVTDITSQNANAIEAFRVARSTVEDRRIMIVTIKHATEGGVLEDSSYKMRALQPDVYKPTTETISDTTAYLMARTDGTEVTAFIAHGDKTAVISYTAGSSDSIYQDSLKDFKTFHWVQ